SYKMENQINETKSLNVKGLILLIGTVFVALIAFATFGSFLSVIGGLIGGFLSAVFFYIFLLHQIVHARLQRSATIYTYLASILYCCRGLVIGVHSFHVFIYHLLFFMSTVDWIVLFITLLSIVLYGLYKSRNIKNIDGYLLGNRSLPWYTVGLSVMATQASAITFLSAPGLAYSSGMSFVQFYFGLPLAMIVLCITFVPIFHRLRVFTAYEFLEKRFDVKTRALTAFLFLIQRGISTGITIFAPSIILSSILHIDVTYTTLA